MPIKAIFLDRDGVVNKEVNYLFKKEDFEFIDGIFDACLYFQNLDYVIIIVTNQSGIARKYYTENDYQTLTKWMLRQFEDNGIEILNVFHCPHGPESTCECRKPKPGMLLKSKEDFPEIEFDKSYLIGDSDSDIQAAFSVGIKSFKVSKEYSLSDWTNEFLLD